jgi:signal transduction histidine kinase
MEASGHVKDLERALEEVRELEQQRADLWQQVAHDLRGNVGVVATATSGLVQSGVPATLRDRFLKVLERNVGLLRHLLDDVTSLARLEAGREKRQLAQVDRGTLLQALCDGLSELAGQRRLTLRTAGAVPFEVEADAVKVCRIAQNLILNAVRYTREGSVTVSWGASDRGDEKRWALTIQDTGPGFHAGTSAPMAAAIETATHLPSPAEPAAGVPAGQAQRTTAPTDQRAPRTEGGEGIGLSIVKRLCELLDATVELESVPDVGTTFRILLPRKY